MASLQSPNKVSHASGHMKHQRLFENHPCIGRSKCGKQNLEIAATTELLPALQLGEKNMPLWHCQCCGCVHLHTNSSLCKQNVRCECGLTTAPCKHDICCTCVKASNLYHPRLNSSLEQHMLETNCCSKASTLPCSTGRTQRHHEYPLQRHTLQGVFMHSSAHHTRSQHPAAAPSS
jgi:hypothetical protein